MLRDRDLCSHWGPYHADIVFLEANLNDDRNAQFCVEWLTTFFFFGGPKAKFGRP